MKVKVEILIEYDRKGETFEAVEDQLMWALDHLYNCGLLSGDLNAEVEDYTRTITEVEE